MSIERRQKRYLTRFLLDAFMPLRKYQRTSAEKYHKQISIHFPAAIFKGTTYFYRIEYDAYRRQITMNGNNHRSENSPSISRAHSLVLSNDARMA
jgi:hypothetical protein